MPTKAEEARNLIVSIIENYSDCLSRMSRREPDVEWDSIFAPQRNDGLSTAQIMNKLINAIGNDLVDEHNREVNRDS